MRIQVYTGEEPMKEFRKAMAATGWGYMLIAAEPPRDGLPWAMDNGAFRYAKEGTHIPSGVFMARVNQAEALGRRPDFCVVPDSPILDNNLSDEDRRRLGRESLWQSIYWMSSRMLPLEWEWHLAVQDGMDREEVREVIQEYGCHVFLGGSDVFKEREAGAWCELAHAENVSFHYARCGSVKKLVHAYQVGADSCDSALMLWSRAKFYRYERAWEALSTGRAARPRTRRRHGPSDLTQQAFTLLTTAGDA